jgi:hypothetical protein
MDDPEYTCKGWTPGSDELVYDPDPDLTMDIDTRVKKPTIYIGYHAVKAREEYMNQLHRAKFYETSNDECSVEIAQNTITHLLHGAKNMDITVDRVYTTFGRFSGQSYCVVNEFKVIELTCKTSNPLPDDESFYFGRLLPEISDGSYISKLTITIIATHGTCGNITKTTIHWTSNNNDLVPEAVKTRIDQMLPAIWTSIKWDDERRTIDF